jgi:hypothetical protein
VDLAGSTAREESSARAGYEGLREIEVPLAPAAREALPDLAALVD